MDWNALEGVFLRGYQVILKAEDVAVGHRWHSVSRVRDVMREDEYLIL